MSVREDIAAMMFERGLGTLAAFYEGLENVPAELLDRQWKVELGYADYYLSHPRIAILAEDQSEPDILQRDRDTLDPEDYQYAQGVRYMWNANFKRIEK